MKNRFDPVLILAATVFVAAVVLQILAYKMCVVGGFRRIGAMIVEHPTTDRQMLQSMVYEQIAGYQGFYLVIGGGALAVSIGAFTFVLFRRMKASGSRDETRERPTAVDS